MEEIPVQQAPSQEERLWAMFTHLSAFVGYFIPFGNIIAPLIIWAIKKDAMPLVNDQGKEAMNFQITLSIALLIAFALCFLLIGIPLLVLLGLAGLILIIIAAVKANDGIPYRYPLTIRFIK